jgi:hypothetical protein
VDAVADAGEQGLRAFVDDGVLAVVQRGQAVDGVVPQA